jgi:hypothetical protein
MAGQTRLFAAEVDGRPLVIGIHGAYSGQSRQPSLRGQGLMLDYFRERMGSQFDAEVMTQAVTAIHDPSGFLLVPPATREGFLDEPPRICPSFRVQPPRCSVLWGKSAADLGIITSLDRPAMPFPTRYIPRSQLSLYSPG